MKMPLILKTHSVRKPLIPKPATLLPIDWIRKLTPTGIYNENPTDAIPVWSVINGARELESIRGERASKHYYTDWYIRLFGEYQPTNDYQLIKHRVGTYLDIMGRISTDGVISDTLLNHFIACWTGNMEKLDELGKTLWKVEKEIQMATANTGGTDNKNKEKKERAPKGHSNLIEQIAEIARKYVKMGDQNPLVSSEMGKDGYRGRRETKLHSVYLMAVKLAKGKNGCYIRDIYRMARENDVPIVKQVSGLLAAHPEVFIIDEDTGNVTIGQFDVDAINAQIVRDVPKTTPKTKTTPKVAPKTKATPKAKAAPKASIKPVVKPKTGIKPILPRKPAAE